MKLPGRIQIIHFRAPLDYPPVYNLAKYLVASNVPVNMVVGKWKKSSAEWLSDGIRLIEVSMDKRSTFNKYHAYITFYWKAFLELLRYPNATIIYFESISSFPVAFYFLLFPFSKRVLAIHFHEYFDIEEMRRQSFLERWGRKFEKFLFKRARWISHTNNDRLSRFSVEFPSIKRDQLRIMQNYPPTSWLNTPASNLKANKKKIRLVYVGSLSLEGLYLEQFVQWLLANADKFQCDIYTNSTDQKVLNFIDGLPHDIIKCNGSVRYSELHRILPNYDVGLILYNGKASTNVVFCAPNKLFEYLACGLDVWYSDDLLSADEYITVGTYPKVIKIDFNKLLEFDYHAALSRDGFTYRKSPYVMEPVYGRLMGVINA